MKALIKSCVNKVGVIFGFLLSYSQGVSETQVRSAARGRVKSIEKIRSGTQMVLELNIHVVGQERPAVINDLIILYM